MVRWAALSVLALGGTAACGPEAPPPESEQTAARIAAEAPAGAAVAAVDGQVVVWKSPTCGCCQGWIEHMEEAGYEVEAHDVGYDVLARKKTELGIPSDLGSCHTGSAGGYSIEGHVPASVIARLLEERPEDIRGLAVPGMPTGSPGMEGPNARPYDVIAIRKDGSRVVYESVYPGQDASETR